MPIYEHSYRRYEGEVRQRFRWFIVLQQELRVLLHSKIFIALLLFALLHVILRVIQLVAYDVIVQDPNNVLAGFLREFQALVVDENTFFDFIRMQGPLMLLTFIYAGAGMICNDAGNNLLDVYFSKPLSWRDYLLGKVSTLLTIGFALTAGPALLLLLIHNMLLPGLDTVTQTSAWILPIMGFSAVLVIPCALGVLASSAMLRSQNYASIAIFMILVANHTFGMLLGIFLRSHTMYLFSFPVSQNYLGQFMFALPRSQASPWAAAGFIVVVSAIALLIVYRRVRRAEIPA